MIESFFEDVRYALRSLVRERFLAFVATLTLATCIGANTTVFSVANSILIRPLVYPSSERVVWISESRVRLDQDIGVAPDYYALREQNQVFEDVASFNPSQLNWTGVERPEQLESADVSVSFFRVMGTRPFLGRYLAADEEGPKSPAVAVISFAFWRNRLGSNSQILGKSIALDRVRHTIVGVMPQGFDFPRGTQVWVPSSVDKSEQSFPLSPTRGLRVVSILARLKPEVTPQQTETELNRLTIGIRAEYKTFQATGFRSDVTLAAMPLQQHLTGPVRPALLVLSGGCRTGSADCLRQSWPILLLARAGGRRRGACCAAGARLEPRPDRPADAYGKSGAGAAGRLGGCRARLDLGTPSGRAQAGDPGAVSGDFDRPARAGCSPIAIDVRNQLAVRHGAGAGGGGGAHPGGAEVGEFGA